MSSHEFAHVVLRVAAPIPSGEEQNCPAWAKQTAEDLAREVGEWAADPDGLAQEGPWVTRVRQTLTGTGLVVVCGVLAETDAAFSA